MLSTSSVDYTTYTNIAFEAFSHSPAQATIVERKTNIVQSVLDVESTVFQSFLFVGFSPAIFVLPAAANIHVTHVEEQLFAQLLQQRPNLKHVNWHQLDQCLDRFDVVIALDEFLTFARSDLDQQAKLNKLCDLAGQLIITTLRDYKNQSFNDREFALPCVVKDGQCDHVYLEHYHTNLQDKNICNRTVYQIKGVDLTVHGEFECRQMFFKQCAKFSIEAGASDFIVHKSIMYKGLLRKNYEHVISIRMTKKWM